VNVHLAAAVRKQINESEQKKHCMIKNTMALYCMHYAAPVRTVI